MDNLSLKKKIIFGLLVLFIFLITAELGLRAILFFTPLGNKNLNLDPYEEPDPNFGWRLKANYHNVRFSPDSKKEEVLIINSKGFRGKEFNAEKTAGVIRIIAMGDSVTFGITPETCPYPAQLQELLDQKYPHKFEVINAGVEGYSSDNVLKRLKYDILQYKPDIITVYVGWNDLYAVNPLAPWNYKQFSELAKFLNKFYLYKGGRKIIFQWLKPRIDRIFNRIFIQDGSDAEIKNAYQKFENINYRENLRQIIKITKDNKIQLVFINLASILSDKMSQDDIRKVHYPYFTSDIEKIKILQDRYNEIIEDEAQKEKIPLVDLNKALNQIPDKGRLFFDTVHLYCEGQRVVAETIFNSLISQKLFNVVK